MDRRAADAWGDGVFHQAMARGGGRLEPGVIDRRYHHLFNFVADAFARHAPAAPNHAGAAAHAPAVRCGLVRSYDLDAVVYAHGGQGFVGINAGLALGLFDVFITLLTRSDVIGGGGAPVAADPEAIKELRGRLDDAPASYRLAERRAGADWGAPRESTRHRVQYALALTYTALRFLVLHEWAHLVEEHLEHVVARGGKPVLWEASRRAAADPSFYQALELEADRAGVAGTIAWLATLAGREQSAFVTTWQDFLGRPAYSFSILSTALGTVFLLLWMKDAGRIEMDGTHPHPSLRLALAKEAAQRTREGSVFASFIAEGWAAGERSMARLGEALADIPVEQLTLNRRQLKSERARLVAGARFVGGGRARGTRRAG